MIARLKSSPAALALPVAILAIFVLLVLPIPTFLLDAFFVLNIALSMAILMVALNSRQPLDFSAFPSVLLFATLLRLALNVASTRIVLVNGHEGDAAAGKVIESFGEFLVGGNFAVGLFVFCILLIINLIVITKGAGRVSEVSARFVLDALPGKQMAIDADIAAGVITAEEARARRETVTVEADFYGSMDGASKFVKGDAIAALLILAVNVIAGFALGMITHGLTASEAAERYITLSVGDALVAQIPALLLSIAAAAIVTRVSDSRDLVGQIGSQFANPSGWLPVALIITAIGLVPAMPQSIFLPGGAIAFAIWYLLRKRAQAPEEPPVAEEAETQSEAIAIADVSDQTLVTLELGFALVHLVDEAKGAPLLTRITGIRKQLSRQFGFVLPQFRIRDSLDLDGQEYCLSLAGVTLGRARLRPDKILAIDSGDVRAGHTITGEKTRDPSFNCEALWIDPHLRDAAIAEGFLTADPATVAATHVNQLLLAHGSALLGPEQVRDIIDAVREDAPGLIEAIYPEPLSLAALTRILRALLDDHISLSHPQAIFTSLAIALQRTQDFDALIDQLRIDLAPQLIAQICSFGETLKVATLDADLESAILGGLSDPATGQPLIEPGCSRVISETIAQIIEKAGGPVALIVQPPVRRALADLLRSRAPQCLVLSINELPASQPVEVAGLIGGGPDGEVPSIAGSPPAGEELGLMASGEAAPSAAGSAASEPLEQGIAA